MTHCDQCQTLAQRISMLEKENAYLRNQLAMRCTKESVEGTIEPVPPPNVATSTGHDDYSRLTRNELQRYGRQMLVPDFSISRQLLLRCARVFIVGAGGLGCPVGLYLSAMGVGTIGIADEDRVERSNLHRQIGHDESTLGEYKVHSLARRMRLLNPDINVHAHVCRVTALNILDLIAPYEIVVDASDNPATRYLLNDACIRQQKTLVSGSALGLEGQVTVYTCENESPCYRCLYPTTPSNPQTCQENGVLGIIPGIIGCIQALETVKVICHMGTTSIGTQLFFDGYDGQFRRLKLTKGRNPNCSSCSTMEPFSNVPTVYTCADEHPPVILSRQHHLSIDAFAMLRNSGALYILIDIRSAVQFEMVHFPEAIHLPFAELEKRHAKKELPKYIFDHIPDVDPKTKMIVICRRGIDSVTVTQWLVDDGQTEVYNVEGGYTKYALEVDSEFPMY